MSANAIFRPTFADLRAEIERRAAHAAQSEEIHALIAQFLLAGGDTPAPCVEYDGTATWLYRDTRASSVSVVGDIIGYDPLKTRMARVPGASASSASMSVCSAAQSLSIAESSAMSPRAPRIAAP